MNYQDILATLTFCLNSIGCFVNFILLIGLFLAYKQVKESRSSLRAQVFMKVYDEWKNPNLYRSIRYIDLLRREWKQQPVNKWDELANEWVKTHVKMNLDSTDPEEKRLAEEWNMRRLASQFLSKMGSLVESGALPEDDFFGVNPEIGRQLSVLIPIEIAIQDYWASTEKPQIAPWDYPVSKWEFNAIWNRYQKWYKAKGSRYTLSPIDWYKTYTI